MPENAPPARAAALQQGQQGQQEESPFRRILGVVQQLVLMWAVSQLVTRFISSKFNTQPASPSITSPVPRASVSSTSEAPVNPFLLPPTHLHPSWPLGQPLSFHVFLTTSTGADVSDGERLPNFVWENISFGDWSDKRTLQLEVDIPKSVRNNGSIWADIFLVKAGFSPDPSSERFDPKAVHHLRKLLTRYMPKTKVRKEKNLLRGTEGEEVVVEEPEEDVIVSHWHPNLTLALISDNPVLTTQQVTPVLAPYVQAVPGYRDSTGTQGAYMPIIFPNDFWHLRSQHYEINQTTPSPLPLSIEFQPMSYFKFQVFASLGAGFDEAAKQQGGPGGGAGQAEIDEIKRMLVETNPWFLGLTALVSVLHVVFEMLAFKSDVSHWRQQKDMVGVSVRTIVTNVVVQIIVLLYLIDNNQDTSWMILMGSGMGVLVEAWKITKAVDIHIVAAPPGSLLPYKIDIRDKHVLSEDEKKTQEYDKLAFRYVSYVAIPCLAGYTIYSLLYETHRGWYSFVISTLTSFVYMFGFAQLIPQLIINYKLKSVAHMPMKAMIYKTLSTVVDDLFAFCIKMPFLHRLACFRDDVVFLIFLYQRWIYRIDPKRVNEYGQIMEGQRKAEGQGKLKDSSSSGETKKTK